MNDQMNLFQEQLESVQHTILLDLNYTLVGNSHIYFKPYTDKIRQETYRQWLVELIKPHHVILMTARKQCYQDLTLKTIKEKTGWLPQEWFFNHSWELEPHDFKEYVLLNHGLLERLDISTTLAIESNRNTHQMYEKYKIRWAKIYKDEAPWRQLPLTI